MYFLSANLPAGQKSVAAPLVSRGHRRAVDVHAVYAGLAAATGAGERDATPIWRAPHQNTGGSIIEGDDGIQ